MSRIILLGGMLAVVAAAGATTLAFKITKPEVAQHRAALVAPAAPIDPATLHQHLQDLSAEMALP
jgi:hypothetical protein